MNSCKQNQQIYLGGTVCLIIEMAPMDGITNYIYRQVFAAHFGGVDRYYTPFISPNQTESLQGREKKELDPANNRGLTVIPQLLTKNPNHFLWGARLAAELGYQEVNYNLGCPSGTVVSKGKGAGMLRDTDYLDRTLEKIFESCPIKVSVKTRIGIADPAEFEDILRVYMRYPISSLIIHPRVQKEFYKGPVHKDSFVLAACNSAIPLVFNGNLTTVSEIAEIEKEFPGIQGVMLGRGMLTDPSLAVKAKVALQKKSSSDDAGKDADAHSRIPALLTMESFADFHEDLVRRNAEVLFGDHQVLHRLKEFWPYWYVNFTNGEKYWKKVRKAKHFSEYRDVVNRLFEEEALIPDAHFESYSIR